MPSIFFDSETRYEYGLRGRVPAFISNFLALRHFRERIGSCYQSFLVKKKRKSLGAVSYQYHHYYHLLLFPLYKYHRSYRKFLHVIFVVETWPNYVVAANQPRDTVSTSVISAYSKSFHWRRRCSKSAAYRADFRSPGHHPGMGLGAANSGSNATRQQHFTQ